MATDRRTTNLRTGAFIFASTNTLFSTESLTATKVSRYKLTPRNQLPVIKLCFFFYFKAATFALQRTAAEILLGQLSGKSSDEEVKEVLRQAFFAVERGYFDSIDDKLAERTNLQIEIPEGLSSYEAYQKYPELVNKLKALNNDIAAGTTAVAALSNLIQSHNYYLSTEQSNQISEK
jgi:hypothetical protein